MRASPYFQVGRRFDEYLRLRFAFWGVWSLFSRALIFQSHLNE